MVLFSCLCTEFSVQQTMTSHSFLKFFSRVPATTSDADITLTANASKRHIAIDRVIAYRYFTRLSLDSEPNFNDKTHCMVKAE